jgi:hypothetical protein
MEILQCLLGEVISVGDVVVGKRYAHEAEVGHCPFVVMAVYRRWVLERGGCRLSQLESRTARTDDFLDVARSDPGRVPAYRNGVKP